jgi:hypothetical protein
MFGLTVAQTTFAVVFNYNLVWKYNTAVVLELSLVIAQFHLFIHKFYRVLEFIGDLLVDHQICSVCGTLAPSREVLPCLVELGESFYD